MKKDEKIKTEGVKDKNEEKEIKTGKKDIYFLFKKLTIFK